jgi:two-component system, chemotaxis family, chemotaxis protein CheY
MRTLIAEDDPLAQQLMLKYLSAYSECDVALDGEEAIRAFRLAQKDNRPYDLVLMDIMMPHVNGQEALLKIREMEKNAGVVGSAEVKVIMTTALGDPKTVVKSYYKSGATAYMVKPVEKEKLLAELRNLGLIS